jgi:hypothetical protein
MHRRFCTFQEAPMGLLKSLFRPSVFQYVVHLERLDGLRITSFHYVQMLDELEVLANYEGQNFAVSMGPEGDLCLSAADQVPEDLFRRVCQHMQAYRRVWPASVISSSKRYAKIAKAAG